MGLNFLKKEMPYCSFVKFNLLDIGVACTILNIVCPPLKWLKTSSQSSCVELKNILHSTSESLKPAANDPEANLVWVPNIDSEFVVIQGFQTIDRRSTSF
jgi:hypothetical protein